MMEEGEFSDPNKDLTEMPFMKCSKDLLKMMKHDSFEEHNEPVPEEEPESGISPEVRERLERIGILAEDLEKGENESEDEGIEDYKEGGYHPVFIGEMLIGRYVVLQKLGWGHFSTVWLVKDIKYETYVAIKIQKSASHYLEAAFDEVEILQKGVKQAEKPLWFKDLRELDEGRRKSYSREDCYTVQLLNAFIYQGPYGKHFCMVFEILGVNLLEIIKRYKYKGIPINLCRKMARQILIGLHYLHSQCGIIHTDLKPENVLLCLDDEELKNIITHKQLYHNEETAKRLDLYRKKLQLGFNYSAEDMERDRKAEEEGKTNEGGKVEEKETAEKVEKAEVAEPEAVVEEKKEGDSKEEEGGPTQKEVIEKQETQQIELNGQMTEYQNQIKDVPVMEQTEKTLNFSKKNQISKIIDVGQQPNTNNGNCSKTHATTIKRQTLIDFSLTTSLNNSIPHPNTDLPSPQSLNKPYSNPRHPGDRHQHRAPHSQHEHPHPEGRVPKRLSFNDRPRRRLRKHFRRTKRQQPLRRRRLR